MRCPGQDPRFWTEDFVFEVPCPECGAAVEFFKDEARGRCPHCGHRFRNPGIDLRCAEWCALAEKCLGFVPERALAAGEKRTALAGRLLQELKDRFAGQPQRLALLLRSFHFARELAAQEGGEPRVVLAAALLYEWAEEADRRAAEQGPQRAPQTSHPQGCAGGEWIADVQNLLAQAGADEETTARVVDVVTCCRQRAAGGAKVPAPAASAQAAVAPEVQIVGDAVQLARLSLELSAACAASEHQAEGAQAPAAERLMAEQGARAERLLSGLSTAAARQRAQAMLAGLGPRATSQEPPR